MPPFTTAYSSMGQFDGPATPASCVCIVDGPPFLDSPLIQPHLASVSHHLQQRVREGQLGEECAICSEPLRNATILNRCLHAFCYACVKEWSATQAQQHQISDHRSDRECCSALPLLVCPLCKQPYNGYIHSITSENDYVEETPGLPSLFTVTYIQLRSSIRHILLGECGEDNVLSSLPWYHTELRERIRANQVLAAYLPHNTQSPLSEHTIDRIAQQVCIALQCQREQD